jgi:hypothetical protein
MATVKAKTAASSALSVPTESEAGF